MAKGTDVSITQKLRISCRVLRLLGNVNLRFKGVRETTVDREVEIISLSTKMDVEIISDEEEHTTGSSDSKAKRRAMGITP